MKKLIIFPFNNGAKQKCLMLQNLLASHSKRAHFRRVQARERHRAFSRQMKRGQTADWPQRMKAASDRMAAGLVVVRRASGEHVAASADLASTDEWRNDRRPGWLTARGKYVWRANLTLYLQNLFWQLRRNPRGNHRIIKNTADVFDVA